MALRRSLAVALALAASLTAAAPPAGSQAPPPAPPPPPNPNPCQGPQAAQLLCPDLKMSPPSHIYVEHAHGRLLVHATNSIDSRGAGPVELRGHRTGRATMRAVQVIHKRGGGKMSVRTGAHLGFKAIPGQGHYWKFWRAARFELWTLNADGTRAQLQRTGPKLSYCFRDLRRVRSWARTPRGRVYPACSQSFGRRELRLGVSPGWADIYPSTYPENWISITGLKGCFAFVHRADPLGDLVEEHEDNNIGQRIIRLPPRGGSVAPRGCPRRG
jgi:hypothetical protein